MVAALQDCGLDRVAVRAPFVTIQQHIWRERPAMVAKKRDNATEIRLEVAPVDDGHDGIAFDELNLFHAACGQMQARRNPVTSEHSITCACGLEIELAGSGEQSILLTAIDGQPRDFTADSQKITITAHEPHG
jgi:hypothetical protein